MYRSRNYLLAIKIGLLYGMAINIAMGADSHFCKKYAQEAVGQYYLAKYHNIPNIYPPVWNSDYEAHKKWCEIPFIHKPMAQMESIKRKVYIESFLKKPGNRLKECKSKIKILPDRGMQIIYPDGKVKIVSDKATITDSREENTTYRSIFTNVPMADMPLEPSNPQEAMWLTNHADKLLEIIKTELQDNASFEEYKRYEGEGLSIYKKIDKRSTIINYLLSP